MNLQELEERAHKVAEAIKGAEASEAIDIIGTAI